MTLLLSSMLLATASGANFFIQAQYRSKTCEGSKVNLFDSVPQASCFSSDGGTTYGFWNCSGVNPTLYGCGSDTTCTTCQASRISFNGTDCADYPVPGLFTGTWSKRFCATELVPFVGQSFILAHTYAAKADCDASDSGKLRKVIGEAVYCANNSVTDASSIKTCSMTASGGVSKDQYACLNTQTCGKCSLVVPTAGRKCAEISKVEYATDSCLGPLVVPGGSTATTAAVSGTTVVGESSTSTSAGTNTGDQTGTTQGGSTVTTTTAAGGSTVSTDAPSTATASAQMATVAIVVLVSVVVLFL